MDRMKIPKTITDWVSRSPVFNMHTNEFEFDLYLSQNDSCLFENDMAIREKYIPLFPKTPVTLYAEFSLSCCTSLVEMMTLGLERWVWI